MTGCAEVAVTEWGEKAFFK